MSDLHSEGIVVQSRGGRSQAPWLRVARHCLDMASWIGPSAILALMPKLNAAVETWLREGTERAMNAHNKAGDGPANQ